MELFIAVSFYASFYALFMHNLCSIKSRIKIFELQFSLQEWFTSNANCKFGLTHHKNKRTEINFSCWFFVHFFESNISLNLTKNTLRFPSKIFVYKWWNNHSVIYRLFLTISGRNFDLSLFETKLTIFNLNFGSE